MKISNCPICGNEPCLTIRIFSNREKEQSFSCSNLGRHSPVRSGIWHTKKLATFDWNKIANDITAFQRSNPVNPVKKEEVQS